MYVYTVEYLASTLASADTFFPFSLDHAFLGLSPNDRVLLAGFLLFLNCSGESVNDVVSRVSRVLEDALFPIVQLKRVDKLSEEIVQKVKPQ